MTGQKGLEGSENHAESLGVKGRLLASGGPWTWAVEFSLVFHSFGIFLLLVVLILFGNCGNIECKYFKWVCTGTGKRLVKVSQILLGTYTSYVSRIVVVLEMRCR